MNTYKVQLDYENETGEFISQEQFVGTLNDCNQFIKNFRRLENNEVGLIIIPITE